MTNQQQIEVLRAMLFFNTKYPGLVEKLIDEPPLLEEWLRELTAPRIAPPVVELPKQTRSVKQRMHPDCFELAIAEEQARGFYCEDIGSLPTAAQYDTRCAYQRCQHPDHRIIAGEDAIFRTLEVPGQRSA